MDSADATAWAEARNLLCIRLDAIGDVLMTTPALRALRDAVPGRRVTLLTSPIGAAIAALVPEIDQVIAYQPPWMKATPPRNDPGLEYAMADTLRQRRFDAAVIFTVYSQSPLPAAMLCYLAQIPLRLAHCHENPYQLLSDWVLDPEPHRQLRHEVQRQLDLVAGIGCTAADQRLSLYAPAALTAQLRRRLQAAGVDLARPWVLIHPGATAPSRRYPALSFARAAAELHERGCQAVFTGSAAEAALVQDIREQMKAPSHSLAGQLNLHELVSAIALAPVALVNNSGPAHIAAALDTPVVDLYALTNLQHTPWQARARVLFHDVPCRSCYKSICPEGHHACLAEVHPTQVVEAVLALLDESGDTAGTTVMPAAPPTSLAPRYGLIGEATGT